MGLGNLVKGIRNRAVLTIKKLRGTPDHFIFVGRDASGSYALPEDFSSVEEIGERQAVQHVTLHDMMPFAVECRMTELRYLQSLDANAVYVDQEAFQRNSAMTGTTYFQPLRIR